MGICHLHIAFTLLCDDDSKIRPNLYWQQYLQKVSIYGLLHTGKKPNRKCIMIAKAENF